MEIYDESDLSAYELERQKNIISNYEFMKSCGLPVKPLVYVKRRKVKQEDLYEYVSEEEETDENDEDWDLKSPHKKRKENKIIPDFKRKVSNPTKFITNLKRSKKENDNSKRTPLKVETAQTPVRNRTRITSVKNEGQLNGRYPKRRVERRDYKEAEVPDDDHYLFCENCSEFYYGDCPVHGSLHPLADNTTKSTSEPFSLATLPSGLKIKESKIPLAGLGVFTTQDLEIGTRFGPYQGKKVCSDICKDEWDTSYMWEVMKEGKVVFYIDGKEEKYGNWMRYINCSRNEKEQNLVAFQYHGEIYYRLYKKAKRGDELLVWYGDEYAKDLGIEAEERKLITEDEIGNHHLLHIFTICTNYAEAFLLMLW